MDFETENNHDQNESDKNQNNQEKQYIERQLEQKKLSSLEKARNLYKALKEIATDEVVLEGAEAGLRTAINTAIVIADTIPGIGDLASWGADAAKLLARYKYHIQLRSVSAKLKEAGMSEDEIKHVTAKTVKMSKFDLTPDASVSLALFTELTEAITGGFAPSHIFEAGVQLKYDRKRIAKAFKKVREILNNALSPSVEEAIEIFEE